MEVIDSKIGSPRRTLLRTGFGETDFERSVDRTNRATLSPMSANGSTIRLETFVAIFSKGPGVARSSHPLNEVRYREPDLVGVVLLQ